jgi:phosphoribosylanthranilate isomerase
LFDTDSKRYGGTGKRFNWQVLENAKMRKPFFLSGGIGLEEVADIKRFNHPQLFAVDVNSRFETGPGVKDLKKVEDFISQIRTC